MRVYISVDMEGIAGVVHQDHTKRDGQDYEQARILMTNEASAAVNGAVQAGAKDVIVNDSHGTMRNIYVERLANQATLISGTPKKLGMMEGIDREIDAAIFIGYHTRSGSQGILNHSYSSRAVSGIKINGKDFGEFGINALLAGEFGVPVVFVSGCNLLIEEAKSHINDIHVAQVKRSVNRVTSENVHPDVACARIEAGVTESLQHAHSIEAYTLAEDEFTFEVTFVNTLLADVAATLPIVQKRDPLTVHYTSTNILNGYLIMRSLVMMANNYA